MDAPPPPLNLSHEQLSQLAGPAGTLGFKLYFDGPARLPLTGSVALAEVPAGDTLSRVELDANGNLRFVRAVRGAPVLSASVPVADMLDLPGWHIFLVWRPNRLVVHCGDVARRRGLRSSH